MREEFGKGNDFCQKITYQHHRRKPEDLIAEFRNSYNPRIAVTVDMIATGTDIKPLEIVIFMRAVKSRTFFEQMKGRGVRVIMPDDLQQRHARRRSARTTSSSSMRGRVRAGQDRLPPAGPEAVRPARQAAAGRRARQHRARRAVLGGRAPGPAGRRT